MMKTEPHPNGCTCSACFDARLADRAGEPEDDDSEHADPAGDPRGDVPPRSAWDREPGSDDDDPPGPSGNGRGNGREGQPADEGSPSTPTDHWPAPMGEAAYHGLVGDVVRAIAPHSEADEAALIVQYLAVFGSAVGRGPYVPVEADRHHSNIYTVLVGPTAGGRKGTSWGNIRSVVGAADPQWAAGCIAGGLSSGEGLIFAVRDAHAAEADEGQEVVDPGVADKRLLVLEPEFVSVLRVLPREGNTLSSAIRLAWDTGTLGVLTKRNPTKATDAHVSIVGHITSPELKRYLSEVDAWNGLVNRFAWVCVRRSKLLPEGGRPDHVTLARLAEQTRAALDDVRRLGDVQRDSEARALWHDVYPGLTADRPGLVGAATARAAPQVLRLALIYALVDRSRLIERRHLEAGLAVWDYAARSAAYIFGDALGDPTADKILSALRAKPGGLTRTQIRDLFGRNRRQKEVERALELLRRLELAHAVMEPSDRGRPTERWRAGARR